MNEKARALWYKFAQTELWMRDETIGVSWSLLSELYSKRQYHNFDHVLSMLKWLEEWPEPMNEYTKTIVACAIWFHDAIYDVNAPAGQNEAQSAKLARLVMNGNVGVTDYVEGVCACIYATEHRVRPRIFPECLIVDLDLAGLAAKHTEYLEASSRIRAEYGNPPWDVWCKGRMAFLNRMLKRERIYWTVPGREWEGQARANMELELQQCQTWVKDS